MSAIALSVSHAEGIDMPKHTHYVAAILSLFSVLMFSMGAELESQAIQRVMKQRSDSPAMVQSANGEIEVIRNHFAMFVIGGGSFAGGVTYVALRILYAKTVIDGIQRQALMAASLLSILTALFVCPAIIKYVIKDNSLEMCAMASFLLAAVATSLWDVVTALGKRYVSAAEKGGIGGLKNEYMGQGITPAQPDKPLPPATEKA